jgi:uncharacterized protein
MISELVQLTFDKVMQTRSYTVVILGTEEKKFAIYLDPAVGKTMQLYLTDRERSRPFTHDLIEMIFQGFNIRLMQVVIVDIQDTIYFAKIFLEQIIGQERHIVEVDARPSDSLILALMHDAPVFCTREVLEKSVAVEE